MAGLVLGYGNPLCGDDGVAWRVVTELKDTLPPGAAVAIHQLTPEWAEAISHADRVVFVDAAAEGPPGEVRCFPLDELKGREGSHETTPGGLLAMARQLYSRRPPAHLVTIAGESFDLSESLTDAVAAAVPVAVERIIDLMRQNGCG